jgi:DNA (cytosine-5)-methyltransferase 1
MLTPGPLAHGVPGRVGLLRGYGNAIVPQAAAEFIAAFLDAADPDPDPDPDTTNTALG